jgi:CheY-like chemotaxis protein
MKKMILAVDDSKAIRFLLQTVLEKEYQVVTLPDGYSAMYYLAHRKAPDLIIAAPQLPDMENWELIQQLSSSGMYGDIPMLVLSGLGVDETRTMCQANNVDKYFFKPFNPVEMAGSIAQLLKKGKVDKDLSLVAG